VPSSVLTGSRVAPARCNRNCRDKASEWCLLPASADIPRRASVSICSLPGLLTEIPALTGEENDPHATAIAGGHGHHGVEP
jgi:hypothetical protein